MTVMSLYMDGVQDSSRRNKITSHARIISTYMVAKY